MNKELSARELYYLHQNPIKNFHFPGEKRLIPENTEEEKNVVEKSLNAIKEVLAAERVERNNTRSDAEWLPNKRVARITRHTGNIYPQLGYMNNNEIFLSPEEVLFSLETNRLNLLWNGVPFSLQQAYIVLLKTKDELNKYRTFQELSSVGYRIPNKEFINKPRSSDANVSPKKMKLDTDNSALENTNSTNKPSKKKENNKEFISLLNNLKADGPSTIDLNTNYDSAFSVYLACPSVKNHDPDYQVSNKSSEDSIKFQDVSLDRSPSLISFSGGESVSFYQLEKVDLDNT